MVRSSFPPGFRFHPTDVELLMYYLKRKIVGRLFYPAISEVDLYKFDPWELPAKSCLQSDDLEWYFFCPGAKKYANGSRKNRTTGSGFWKATGEDKSVCYKSQTVGMRKTLVFHTGKSTRGARTNWVMHEYKLELKDLVDARFSQDAYVICKIHKKGGPGPRNGEQYGAPFNEENWDDEVEDNYLISLPLANLSSTSTDPAEGPNLSMITTTTDTKEACDLSLESVPQHNGNSAMGDEYFDISEFLRELPDHDDDVALVSDANRQDEELDSCILPHTGVEDAAGVDEDEIYEGLEDITGRVRLNTSENLYCLNSMEHSYPMREKPPEVEDGSYIELNDLIHMMEADGFEHNISGDFFPYHGNYGNFEDFHEQPIPLDTAMSACGKNRSHAILPPERFGISEDQLAAISEIDNLGGNSSWQCPAAVRSPTHSRKRRKTGIYTAIPGSK